MAAGVDGDERGYALTLEPREIERYRMMAEQARAVEADHWHRAGIRPGAKVADVGCGPGALLPVLAAAVGSEGQVIGVDSDPAAVAAAREYTSGIEGISVLEGTAERTGLEPGSLDVVTMRHVLAHNGGREQAIVSHLASLLRPGGCVHLVDAYAPGLTVVPEVPVLKEINERYRAFQAARGNPLRTGVQLGEWLSGAGLEVLDFRGQYQVIQAQPGLRPPALAAGDAMVAAGIATKEDLDRWERELDVLDTVPERPSLFLPLFSAIGQRRPAS